MTFEELLEIYYKAEAKGTDRDAVRAVVEAIREATQLRPGGCEQCKHNLIVLHEILASDGEDKAAGASTRKDEVGARTPASSPAAALTHAPGCPANIVYECTCSFHTRADHPSYVSYMNETLPMKVATAADPVCEWKDFKDRPAESCRVLWLYKVEHPKSWVYACASGRWHKIPDGGMAYQEDFESDEDYGRPSHWMPLPTPPKEGR